MNYYQGVPTSKISPTERQLNLVIALLNTSTYLTAEEIRQSVAGYDAHNGEAGRQMFERDKHCLLYTSPSPRDQRGSRMPSSA